jgi:hypothetical protein
VKRTLAILSVAVVLVAGCTGDDPNGPTPGGSFSPRCLAFMKAYEDAKTAAEADRSDETEAALERAQGRLFSSGCLKS